MSQNEDSEREFGNHWIYNMHTGESVPVYEWKNGEWARTPECVDEVRKERGG